MHGPELAAAILNPTPSGAANSNGLWYSIIGANTSAALKGVPPTAKR